MDLECDSLDLQKVPLSGLASLSVSPRSASTAEPLSPLSVASSSDALESPGLARPLRLAVQATLSVMASQARIDAQIEGAKASIPSDVSLASIFLLLDPRRKDYVTDDDLWNFTSKMGFHQPIGSLTALVRAVQRDGDPTDPRLSLREVGTLVFPHRSQEHRLMFDAGSDVEAMFLLQCASEARIAQAVPWEVQRQLARLITVAARATVGLHTALLEFDRLGLDEQALEEVFTHIAGGSGLLSDSALQCAFTDYGFPRAVMDIEFLWQRYVPGLAVLPGGRQMRFLDFRGQLHRT